MITRRGLFGMMAGLAGLLTARAAKAAPEHPVDALKRYVGRADDADAPNEIKARAFCDEPVWQQPFRMPITLTLAPHAPHPPWGTLMCVESASGRGYYRVAQCDGDEYVLVPDEQLGYSMTEPLSR